MDDTTNADTEFAPEPSRRSLLLFFLTALGGLFGVTASLASAILKYVSGPAATKERENELLEERKKSLASEVELIDLKLERAKRNRIELADLSDLEVGTGLFFTDYVLQPGILFKTGDRTCKAYSAVCTHLGCTIQSSLVDGKMFCPCHQSYFSLDSGAPLEGPASISIAEEPIVIDGEKVYLVRPSSPIKIGPDQIPMSAI